MAATTYIMLKKLANPNPNHQYDIIYVRELVHCFTSLSSLCMLVSQIND